MNITWLGHSATLIETSGKRLLIDPFLSGNPTFPSAKRAEVTQNIDYILLTHGHSDHLGDTLQIAKENQATVVATFELASFCGGQGVKNIEMMNLGGTIEVDGNIKITMTQAFHSSSVESEGQFLNTGDPAGFVIRAQGQSIYHAGDTCLFSDMKLIDELYKPSVGLLPIGDRFTMGPSEAAYACNTFFNFETVIPIHHSTFELLTGTPQDFARQVKKGKVIMPKAGEVISITARKSAAA